MRRTHAFAKRALNGLDIDGQEGCATCGAFRGVHVTIDPATSPATDERQQQPRRTIFPDDVQDAQV